MAETETFPLLRSTIRANTGLPSPEEQEALMRAAGLSRLDVARELGVSRAAVITWVTGRRSPRGEVRRKYHQLLLVVREELEADSVEINIGGARSMN